LLSLTKQTQPQTVIFDSKSQNFLTVHWFRAGAAVPYLFRYWTVKKDMKSLGLSQKNMHILGTNEDGKARRQPANTDLHLKMAAEMVCAHASWDYKP